MLYHAEYKNIGDKELKYFLDSVNFFVMYCASRHSPITGFKTLRLQIVQQSINLLFNQKKCYFR